MRDHDVTIEASQDGDLVLTCSCGATSDIHGYAIDLDDANEWANNHSEPNNRNETE